MNSAPPRGPGGGTHRRLLEAAQRGDRFAQEELVRRYEPLVQRVVWTLRLPPGCEREDLAQEARLGLLAAIRAWRPERGPFPAFADRCVSNQALLALKATSARKHQVLSLAASLDVATRALRQLIRRLPGASAARHARRTPRRTHRPRTAAAPARTAHERAARPPCAHRQRACRARDGAERTEPHAARRHPPRLASRRFAGGPPRAAQARRCRRAGGLTHPGDIWVCAPGTRPQPSPGDPSRHSPGGWRSTNPAGPVPTVLHRGPVDGGLGGLPSPAAVSK